MIVGGIFWSLAYFLMIRQGFKDKTYGMPLADSLCKHFLGGNIRFSSSASATAALHKLCLVRPRYSHCFSIPKIWQKRIFKILYIQFYLIFTFAIVMSFCSILFVTYEFQDWQGAYAAFGQNLMMSVLFLWMFFNRDDLRGQSVYIALFKMIGTGVSSLAFFLYQPISQGSYLMPYLYIAIFICDAVYSVLVYRRSVREAKEKLQQNIKIK